MKIVKSIFVIAVLLSSVFLVLASRGMSPKILHVLPSGVDKTSGLTTPTRKKATLAETQMTIPVSADTYIYGRYRIAPTTASATNYGSSTEILLKYTQDVDYNRIGLLKFDLSGIDESKGRIVKAELQLFIKGTDAMNSATKRQNFDDTPYIVSYLKDDSWDVNTITWNNYLAYAQSAAEVARVMGNAIPYTQVNATNWAVAVNQQITWDIAATVRKDFMDDAAKTLSLTLSSTAVAANMGLTLHSSENGNPAYEPRLVITQDEDIPFSLPEDSEPTEFDKILENIRTMLYDEAGSFSTISTQAQGYLNSINSNGSWSDLTYTGDVPTAHLDRLKTMALAYTNSQSSLYGNTALYTAIVNAIQWWYNQNPDHSNWFYDQIAYPQRMGETLVLMRDGAQKIPVLLELNTLSRMRSQGGAPDQGGSQGTGANKMNIAMHWIYRGCLAEDKAVLDKGVQQAFYPLSLTTGEGLQPDYSYLQHGQQLYIGGYGWDIVNVATRVALYTVETSYAQGNDNLDNLGIFLRQAYLRVIRGQNFMFNAFGRGIARANGVSQSGFGTLLRRMKVVDPTYATTYDAAIARLDNSQPASYGVEIAHTHFYRSDYTLQTKPGYTFELRTVSTRTLRNENGNGENIRGYFLSDGATSIAVTGTEYYNVFPTWDWSMIPGTTTRKGTMVTPAQWGTSGTTAFVGGVSDTTRGVSVYDLNNNSTQAKKAYFFFDDEVVCLGAGISTTSGTQEVVTTLNQCLLQSDVMISVGGTVTTHSGSNTNLDYNDNLEWVIQGNVGYVLPEGGNVGLTAIPQTGKWSTINTSASTADVTQNVFTLWMKHGVSPTNANYAYIVVPNVSQATQMQDYMAKDNIQILKNEATIQAVKHKELGLHGFVFHHAASQFTNDTVSIEVSNPCLMMVQPVQNGTLRLHVSDPTKTLSSVTVRIAWPGLIGTKEVTVNLPTATESAGKSVVAYIVEEYTMPLDILSFEGQRQPEAVSLIWQTANEVNVDRFEIWAKETDGTPVYVGQVPANNLISPNDYNFLDATPSDKEVYYQLRVVDKDGITSYSDYIRIPGSINDDFTGTPIKAGENTPSVADNDIINGSVAIIGSQNGEFTLSSTDVPAVLEFNTTTGVITAKANAPSGTYTFGYTICENNASPVNCLVAYVKVRVWNELAAANDDFSDSSVYPEGSTASVLTNDMYNGGLVVVGTTPGTVTLSSTNVPTALEFNTATGVITAKANAPSDTYTFEYTICENGANPANCKVAEVKVSVFNEQVVANNDDFSGTPISSGGSTVSVLANDTYTGGSIVIGTALGAITLSSTNVPATLEFNTATGSVTAQSNTPSGTYMFDYTICVNGAGSAGCATAHVQVVVRNTIDATDDNPTMVNGYTGGEISSILSNDTFNGTAIPVGTVMLTVLTPASPVNGGKIPALDTETGKINIDAQTPAGDYQIVYQLCEVGASPANCASASVAIQVGHAELKTEADHFVVQPSGEAFRTASVLENDKLNNTALIAGQYILTPGEPSNTALSMDNSGVITVPSSLKTGIYTYSYSVCEVLNPNNCSQAVATIEVIGTEELFIPNIFTPNGDGKNQFFQIVGIEFYDRIELIILNKWGDQLYTNSKYDNRWDGRGLASGTYLYFIKATKDQETKTIKGYITIKRY